MESGGKGRRTGGRSICAQYSRGVESGALDRSEAASNGYRWGGGLDVGPGKKTKDP